jgi:6,7-dimethyl-8-ribityllumazine synthase
MNQSEAQHTSIQTIRSAGRIAFIQALWHRDIVDQAWAGFTARAHEHGIDAARIDRHEVPGSLEIPLHAKRIAEAGQHALIVAAGLIVDGGIYRHDFVASTVLDGMMRVQLDSNVPILSVVLTPHHFHDGAEHQEYFHAHLLKKGSEAADACALTLANLDLLRVSATG